MSKKTVRALLVLLVILIVGSVAAYFLVGYMQKQQWVLRTAQTSAMAKLRDAAPNKALEAISLVKQETQQDDKTFYNGFYYPQARSAICTVDKPLEYDRVAVYLVGKNGKSYGGWTDATLLNRGVMKVAFENLDTADFLYLDMLNWTDIPADGYDPAVEIASRTRFTLG